MISLVVMSLAFTGCMVVRQTSTFDSSDELRSIGPVHMRLSPAFDVDHNAYARRDVRGFRLYIRFDDPSMTNTAAMPQNISSTYIYFDNRNRGTSTPVPLSVKEIKPTPGTPSLKDFNVLLVPAQHQDPANFGRPLAGNYKLCFEFDMGATRYHSVFDARIDYPYRVHFGVPMFLGWKD
jgi:hypothetical protein